MSQSVTLEKVFERIENKIESKIDSLASKDSGINWEAVRDNFSMMRNCALFTGVAGIGLAVATYQGALLPAVGGAGILMAMTSGLMGMTAQVAKDVSTSMADRSNELDRLFKDSPVEEKIVSKKRNMPRP